MLEKKAVHLSIVARVFRFFNEGEGGKERAKIVNGVSEKKK